MANRYDLEGSGSKRVGNPYASKHPVTDLESLLDHYFADARIDYSFHDGYVDPSLNHEDPKKDLI